MLIPDIDLYSRLFLKGLSPEAHTPPVGRRQGCTGSPTDVSALSQGPEPLSIGVAPPAPDTPWLHTGGRGWGGRRPTAPCGAWVHSWGGRETSRAGLRLPLRFHILLPEAVRGSRVHRPAPVFLQVGLKRRCFWLPQQRSAVLKKIQMIRKYIKFH